MGFEEWYGKHDLKYRLELYLMTVITGTDMVSGFSFLRFALGGE